jgi:hypothetical protein
VNDDLTRALGDLADGMTDDPQRLTAVHRKVRSLRHRRIAARGTVAAGALGMAAVAGAALRPSGSGPDTQVTATQPTDPTATPPTTECAPPTTPPPTVWPAGADYLLTSFMTGQIERIDSDTVTLERLSASENLPATITLPRNEHLTYADGDTDIADPGLHVGQTVSLWIAQPEGSTGWDYANVVINVDPDSAHLPDDAVVDGNSITIPDC